jgi:hypothetical protein
MWGGVFPTCGEVCGDIWGGCQDDKRPARHTLYCWCIWQGDVDACAGNACAWLEQI